MARYRDLPAITSEERAELANVDPYEALARIRRIPNAAPFADFIPVEVAPEAEKYFDKGFLSLHAETRAAALKIVQFVLEEGGWRYSNAEICRRIGIPYLRICTLRITWMYWVTFLNLLQSTQLYSGVGRVDLATLDRAVDGGHQDRRLYYERVGLLKQKEVSRGGAIIFLNDNISRPQPKVLDAEVVESEES